MKKVNSAVFYTVSLIIILIGSLLFIILSDNNSLAERLAEIELGSSKDEVLYVRGKPYYVFKENIFDTKRNWLIEITGSDVSKIKDDYRNYKTWVITISDIDASVSFDEENKVNAITCTSISGEITEASKENCNIFGVTLNSSEELVLNKLGRPSGQSINEGIKRMVFNQRNLAVLLKEKKVTGIIISSNITTIN